jgi:hypothetical protein
MRVWGAVVAALVLAAAEAVAGEPVPVLEANRFELGHAPASIASSTANPGDRERPQAVNGVPYAVVAPLYVGDGGFVSYLRLFNGGAATAAFTVSVVGSGTATNYGTATFQVPPRASIQYSMSQVLVGANAVNRNDADAQFSFYIQSTEPLAGYQHVTHKESASFFQNASVCKWTIQDAVAAVAPSVILTNVHTSRLAALGYPASIELHNYAATPVTYRFTVIEAASGNIVGETTFPTRANASYTIPWAQIESAINWSPLANQVLANVVISDTTGATPAAVAGQTVLNGPLQYTLNISTMCAVTRPTGLGGDGGGTIN